MSVPMTIALALVAICYGWIFAWNLSHGGWPGEAPAERKRSPDDDYVLDFLLGLVVLGLDAFLITHPILELLLAIILIVGMAFRMYLYVGDQRALGR